MLQLIGRELQAGQGFVVAIQTIVGQTGATSSTVLRPGLLSLQPMQRRDKRMGSGVGAVQKLLRKNMKPKSCTLACCTLHVIQDKLLQTLAMYMCKRL